MSDDHKNVKPHPWPGPWGFGNTNCPGGHVYDIGHHDRTYRAMYAIGRPHETPEQRAFRRFPITAHKPGGLTT